MSLRPFPYEGSISKFPDQINASPIFFGFQIPSKGRLQTSIWHALWGSRASKKELRSFYKTKSKFLHTLKIPSIGGNISLHRCVVIHHRCNCHCHTMSSSSTTSSASSDDSDNEPSDDDNEEEEQEAEPTTKMLPYHAKNYLIQPWEVRIYPDHKDPPFSKSKAYHSEVKPDSATLKLKVVRQWKAYTPTGCQPRPSNWKIDKCIDYLMSNPIATLEEADLDWLESELGKWKGIQVTINESHQNADDQILHHSWTSDIPFLRLYHTLVEDGI